MGSEFHCIHDAGEQVSRYGLFGRKRIPSNRHEAQSQIAQTEYKHKINKKILV